MLKPGDKIEIVRLDAEQYVVHLNGKRLLLSSLTGTLTHCFCTYEQAAIALNKFVKANTPKKRVVPEVVYTYVVREDHGGY